MGYITQFVIECDAGDGILHECIRACPGSRLYSNFIRGDEPYNSLIKEYCGKWYSYESDMEEFSSKFPDYVFSLIGLGEDGFSDLWVISARAGHVEKKRGRVITDYGSEVTTQHRECAVCPRCLGHNP